ncbi:acyl carrier protein [Streptomyces seoulensis]|uniref:Acyl carrier protein n=1 Tax=Streptomyces seoulensis TaxID=73044 RepID=A0A4P6U106_STRSO|nr:acyl carrier protein [Streptomyces seoulensis]QBJ93609.1 acyl carrier protein [Streptomyces seoulensis]
MTVDVTTPEVRATAAQIAEIFAEVLGSDGVPGTDSGFLDIGGDSLTAARAVSLISSRLGARITVRDLFRSGTADALAVVALRRRDS